MAYQKEERGGRDRSDRNEERYEKDGDGRRGGGFSRRKACRFCTDQEFISDYKDVRMMQSFITEHGKLIARHVSGNCAYHQRRLATDVKRARNLALVGYVSMGA